MISIINFSLRPIGAYAPAGQFRHFRHFRHLLFFFPLFHILVKALDMLLGQFASQFNVSIFDCLDQIAKVIIIFLQLRLIHGKKSIVIAMDIVMDGVEDGDINRVAGDLGHGHVDLLIDINERISVGATLSYTRMGCCQ